MKGRTLYVESSALLTVAMEQGPFDQISGRLDLAARLVTSRLTRIECARALLRAAREGAPELSVVLTEQGIELLFERIELFEIDAEVAALASRIAPASALRSLDAIHLATWQLYRSLDPEVELLTCDRRLAAAAGVEPA